MIDIIKAGGSQLGDALALRREMLGVVNGVSSEYFEGDFDKRSAEYFTNGEQTTVLAYDGERAIGCATICYITFMPTYSHPTGKRGHIMNVYTRQEYRRQGIARRMVSAIIDEARQRGVTHISLDATESGKPLYRALGFELSHEAMGLNLT